jgi:hypothetical protein
MAQYKSRDEFMGAIRSIIGENNSDEALAFVENMADTYDAMTSTDWEARYAQLDTEWREKFKQRFFEGANEPSPAKTEPKTEIEIDDLFTEVKK